MPFIFTRYLQQVLQCPLVIQLTDDEKFFYQGQENAKDILEFKEMGNKNAKDIIACGFDKDRTFIFSDTDYIGTMYPNICRFQRLLTYSQCTFGLSKRQRNFWPQARRQLRKVVFPSYSSSPLFQ